MYINVVFNVGSDVESDYRDSMLGEVPTISPLSSSALCSSLLSLCGKSMPPIPWYLGRSSAKPRKP